MNVSKRACPGKPCMSIAFACGLVTLSGVANALPVTFFRDLDFHASQGFWGPGSTSLDFMKSGQVGSTVGVKYEAKASSGNVTGDYNGTLKIGLDTQNPRSMTLSFLGDPMGGSIDTFLGASLKADAFARVKVPIWGTLVGRRNLLDLNYSLGIDTAFTPTLGQQITGSSNELTLISPQFRIGVFVAGVDANVDQDLTFMPVAIRGNITETLRGTNITEIVPFILNSDSVTIPLQYSSRGIWDIALTDLQLDNVFSTGFDLSLDPFIRLDLPGKRFDATLLDIDGPTFDLYSTPRFALAFGEVDNLFKTTVTIDEPAALAPALLGALLLGFAASRKGSSLRS